MKAKDLIIQIRSDLQEKSQQWKDEELFVKLQSSYATLQTDFPFFIAKETIAIRKDKTEYYLLYEALRNITLTIDAITFKYTPIENFHITKERARYSFYQNTFVINEIPTADTTGVIVYRHAKVLENINCEIELPVSYIKALKLLFKSDIYEKPTRNTKERNLNLHYLKLYNIALSELKADINTRASGVTSKYQKI